MSGDMRRIDFEFHMESMALLPFYTSVTEQIISLLVRVKCYNIVE